MQYMGNGVIYLKDRKTVFQNKLRNRVEYVLAHLFKKNVKN